MATMIRQTKIITICSAICIFLTACAPRTTTVNGMQCIQPKLDAIPTEMPLYWDTNGSRSPRQMPSRKLIPPWMVSQLSWSQQRQISSVDYSVDMVVRENIIWMAYLDFIVRYNLSTNQLGLYDFGKEGSVLRIDDMLITKDNNLWVAGTRLSKNEQYTVLLRYDSKKDSFDAVEDVDGLLSPPIGGNEKIIDWGQDRILKESLSGDVLFIFRGGIYSYNPAANRAAVIFSNPEITITAIEADPRDWIWFTILGDDSVWVISPESDQPQSFELPDLYPGTEKLSGKYFRNGYALYLDSHERLWIPAWAFLDTSKQEFTWQILNPSPLFVNLYDSDNIYAWDKAKIFETQDNSIWFTSVNGVIHYDMETETACWISPEPGPIVEMPDGAIGVLLKNQLYRYDELYR